MIAGVRKNACLGQGLCDFFVSFTGVCHLLVRYVTGPARTTEHKLASLMNKTSYI
jgi:hypothetical protein